MKRIIVFYIFCCFSFFVSAQCTSDALKKNNALVFKSGESLTYNGYYNWGFIWVKAGIVNFNTTIDNDIYNIKSVCSSCKAWDWFFKLRDTITTSGNVNTYKPNKFLRVVHEGSYRARFDYVFNYDSAHIVSNGFKKKDVFVNKKIKLDTPAMDIITFAWYVRNIDFDRHVYNEKIPVRLIISNDIYNLYIRYKGIEKIKLRTGERVECYKFSPMLIKGTTFNGGEKMFVWITKDRNRVPIMVQAEVVVGSVKAVLSSYKNIKYTSEIFPSESGSMGSDVSDR